MRDHTSIKPRFIPSFMLRDQSWQGWGGPISGEKIWVIHRQGKIPSHCVLSLAQAMLLLCPIVSVSVSLRFSFYLAVTLFPVISVCFSEFF